MATKKPTPVQLKILQQLNEDICILRYKYGSLDLWSKLYDLQNSKTIRSNITTKTLELLIFHEWVKIDHEKTNGNNYYYFITENGKAIINENKEA